MFSLENVMWQLDIKSAASWPVHFCPKLFYIIPSVNTAHKLLPLRFHTYLTDPTTEQVTGLRQGSFFVVVVSLENRTKPKNVTHTVCSNPLLTTLSLWQLLCQRGKVGNPGLSFFFYFKRRVLNIDICCLSSYLQGSLN